jgi:cyclopropane fatty-acyl-phospholipid synthase-like methyltransferase
MTTIGFEYKNKKTETPFETFLRYTDEKEKSAARLAAILQKKLSADSHILDIGTGNGEYLDLALSKIDGSNGIKLTLVEPSDDLVRQLKSRFEKQPLSANLRIVNSDLQSFDSDEKFDVILMSHLFYHVPRASWTEQLAKALSLLEQGGALIIVLREKDDVYEFKMAFKPLLFDASFKALTIDDVLDTLPEITGLSIVKQTAIAELKVPFADRSDDTISIIEFFLNKEWHEIPPTIQRSSLEFIKKRAGIFRQLDGIAVIEKA